MRELGRYKIEPISFSKYTKPIGEGVKKLGGNAPIFFNTSSQIKVDRSIASVSEQLKSTPYTDFKKSALKEEIKSYVNIADDLVDDKLLKFKDAERLGRTDLRVEQYARNFMMKSDKKNS